jgi:hypothetical protein
MGPLFALAALAVVGATATLIAFVFTLLFLPPRSALVFSPVLVGAGMMGCAVGVIIQVPFVSGETRTTLDIFRYFGIIVSAGVLASILAAFIFSWLRRRVLSRLEAKAVARYFD